MAAERRARAVWEGTLLEGQGRLSTESTPVLSDQPVTWASRTEDPGGRTSPEELLAAAHAACYADGGGRTLSRAWGSFLAVREGLEAWRGEDHG